MTDTNITHPDIENTLDMCCGGKKCPVVTLNGDEMVVTDNGQTVSFTREQWHQLTDWASKKCF